MHLGGWTRASRIRGLSAAGAALAVTGLLATGTIVSGGPVRAQDLATPATTKAAGVQTVSVSGHGEVTIAPDTASISIGVDVTQPTLTDAQAQATEQATAVIATLKAAGIADEDIQTTSFNVYILRDTSRHADPNLITGFEITNQLEVTVRDTEILGQLLDKAVKAGANNVSGISFYVDDQTAAAREARRLAVEDARTKAEELATAAGLTLGPVIVITEGAQAPVLPIYPVPDGAMAKADAAVPVESGSSTVAVDVSMTFELR
jgi:uncharacterized protein YggE